MKDGFYYSYEWFKGKFNGPIKGAVEDSKPLNTKTYFHVSGLNIKFRVYSKPGVVNAYRVYNMWLEDPDTKKAKQIFLKELQKRKKDHEIFAAMLGDSIEALKSSSE